MTTFGDLIEETYRLAQGTRRERTVLLNNGGTLTSGATTVPVTGAQASGIRAGVILSLEMELMYVTSYSSPNATVIRGWNGSTAASHADGQLIYINPPFSRFGIGRAINEDLMSLSSPMNGLFRVGVGTVTFVPPFRGYDLGSLPANFHDVVQVRYKTIAPFRRYPDITGWEVIHSPASTEPDFASGNALILDGDEYGDPGQPIYVWYAAPFVPLVALTDDVNNTPVANDPAPPANGYAGSTTPNLPFTCNDLPILGALIALTQPQEIARNRTASQPDPHRAEEIPPQAIATAVNPIIARRTARISEEADRLAVTYPRYRK